MNFLICLTVAFISYMIGSIPTALLYSRLKSDEDIRRLGDGNMGARNSKRQYGWKAGVLIALADILKGALAILLANAFSLPFEWRLLAGSAVIIGHDFPIFAGFKGGQGFATTTGVFLGLFPFITLIGFAIYVVLYFTTHNSDLAASFGMGFIVFSTLLKGESALAIGFMLAALLFIPFKKWLDRSREQPFQKNIQGTYRLRK